MPTLDWRPCHDGFECATAVVPRDYARPRGAQVRLALIRHPALDASHRIGTLFVNPGGPGFSGVSMVLETPPQAFAALSRFDWVGFGPRGVGASEPAVDCDELDAPLQPMTPDNFDLRVLLRRASALSKLCLNRDPAFLASLTTGNVARDLDVLRTAVGAARLSYVGFSYGGMIGETYASLFPGRARALVLDSTIDADVWLNRPLQASIEQSVGFEDALDRFFAACAADQPTCGFGGDDPEQGAAPVLVLQSTHDPATPYEWGRRAVRQLGNARLLTLRGDGHGVLTQLNACALAAVVPYLNDLTLPPQGASCDQDVPGRTT